MGLMDSFEDKAKEMMNDPEKKRRIEQLAKEKGISLEQAAKEHYMKHENTK